MSKIKLKHSSGNSMSIGAPATNPASDLELKLPATIGNAGQALINSSTPGTLEFGTPAAASRNLISNGSQIISQRGATFASAANGYTTDRWRWEQSNDGAVTVSQSTTSPDGFSNSLKVDVTTADTSITGSQYAEVYQVIEAQNLQQLAYGTSSAKTMTLSFYVRSNKTGNYGIALHQADNGSKQMSLQYAINSADTWERKTLTIAADTAGVINNDTGSGILIFWVLAAGPSYTSGSLRSNWTAFSAGDFAKGQEVNLMDSTSNEWHITGVQLEVGSYATDFEHRSFGDELLRCQRYFQAFPYNDTSTAQGLRLNGDFSTVTSVPMRTTPGGVVYGTGGIAGSNSGKYDKDAVGNTTASIEAKITGFEIDTDGGVGIAAVTLDAEL